MQFNHITSNFIVDSDSISLEKSDLEKCILVIKAANTSFMGNMKVIGYIISKDVIELLTKLM